MKTVEKQGLPVILLNGEPVAVIFYSRNRERVVYTLEQASEEELIALIEDEEEKPKIKK